MSVCTFPTRPGSDHDVCQLDTTGSAPARASIPLSKAPGLAAGLCRTPPRPAVQPRARFACLRNFLQTFWDSKQADVTPQRCPGRRLMPPHHHHCEAWSWGGPRDPPQSWIFVFRVQSPPRMENKRSNHSGAVCTNSQVNNAAPCCVISIQFSALLSESRPFLPATKQLALADKAELESERFNSACAVLTAPPNQRRCECFLSSYTLGVFPRMLHHSINLK